MAGRFARFETRGRTRGFLLGMLADRPRKNCWTIAEHAGDCDPHGMQHLLNRAVWDTDGVRDDLRDYVTTNLGDADAVLVVDETGDLKKGVCTVGVQRQYTGTAGRIENAQVAVYLTYADARGHAMIDRELYLPRSWTSDDQRCVVAGVPADIEFATKPTLATGMVVRALNAGARPGGWPGTRSTAPTPHCVPSWRPAGPATCWPSAATAGSRPPRVCCVPTNSPPASRGGRGSGSPPGPGAKGQRYYWALITQPDPTGADDDPVDRQCWWLLVRRHRDTGELAFYRCYSPHVIPLRELVRVAGRRWTVEESFQANKGLAGLDEHQVRRWASRRRWTLLAHALLAVIAAHEHADRPAAVGLIALTCNETRRLLTTLVIEPGRAVACPQAWSLWRRRHQHRARTSHYRRQEAACTRT